MNHLEITELAIAAAQNVLDRELTGLEKAILVYGLDVARIEWQKTN
jgi:hypothetical protein